MVKKDNPEAQANNQDPAKDKHHTKNNKNKQNQEKPISDEVEKLKIELETTVQKLNESQDKYLRLSAEFDNYRKRTLKEKTDLLKSGGEETILKVLPVLDDFERAMLAMQSTSEIEAVKNGISLIYSKLKDTLTQQGIKEIESINLDFNTDLHEAITKIPAPTEELKGKVVDVVQKGYYLNDKVLRFAKVVIGE
jgi:molecular chaperone GrpE